MQQKPYLAVEEIIMLFILTTIFFKVNLKSNGYSAGMVNKILGLMITNYCLSTYIVVTPFLKNFLTHPNIHICIDTHPPTTHV